MENQTNVSDKKTQQIEQNPVVQPIQTPQKQKTDYLIIGLVILVCFVLFGFGGYYFGKQSSKSLQQASQNQYQPPATISVITDPTVNWKTYIDPNNNYQFKYPIEYSLATFATRPLLNRKIVWYEVTRDPSQHCPDCPLRETSQPVKLPYVDATKITGYAGDIGGGVAQSFISYEIKIANSNKLVIFELWELPQNLTDTEFKSYQPGRKVGVIPDQEQKVFDQILSTFKFLDGQQMTIYKNTKHGYQLDYTNNLFGDNLSPASDSAFWASKPGVGAPLELGSDGYWLNITVYSDANLISIYQKLINMEIGETGSGEFKDRLTKLSSLNTSSIAGATFLSKLPSNFQGEAAYAYDAVWIRDSKLYRFNLGFLSEVTRNLHKSDFDKIVSSFKFIN